MKGKDKLEEVHNKHIEVDVRKDYRKLVQQEQAEVEKKIGLDDVLRKEEWGDAPVYARAPHELTCGLIRIRPTGIFYFKIQTRIRADNFPWVIRLNRSGTCMFAGTCKYFRELL
jgi:hypothetical protein